MKKMLGCSTCDWTTPLGQLILRCPVCGSLTEFVLDRAEAKLRDSSNPLERYFDLLPIQRQENLRWLGDGNTPTLRAETLGRCVGLRNLWLKVEGANPTGSTKDRAFSVVYSYLRECGISEFGMCSTGNSSTACATGAQRLAGEFRAHVFCGLEFKHRLNIQSSDHVRVYLVDGDFVETEAAAKRICAERNILWEGGFFNPARRAGHKLAYLEAFDQMAEPPEIVLQAVSSGMGVLGLNQACLDYLAMGRLPSMPRMIAVQQASCAPMVRAWNEGADAIKPEHIIRKPSGLAKAILRGNPSSTYPLLKQAIAASGGAFVGVTAAEIVQARWLALTCERLSICYASAAALAAAIKMRKSGEVERDTQVLVNLTGTDRAANVGPERYELVSPAAAVAS